VTVGFTVGRGAVTAEKAVITCTCAGEGVTVAMIPAVVRTRGKLAAIAIESIHTSAESSLKVADPALVAVRVTGVLRTVVSGETIIAVANTVFAKTIATAARRARDILSGPTILAREAIETAAFPTLFINMTESVAVAIMLAAIVRTVQPRKSVIALAESLNALAVARAIVGTFLSITSDAFPVGLTNAGPLVTDTL
jgi:hypothetical protein